MVPTFLAASTSTTRGGGISYAGEYRVGSQVKPGTYYVKEPGDNCYWER
jgi:hypothetical protein